MTRTPLARLPEVRVADSGQIREASGLRVAAEFATIAAVFATGGQYLY